MRHTCDEVTRRARREFEQLDRVVARLRPSDWNKRVPRPEAKDPWTVKDALAHIVHWKEHTARVIRGERRPPELRGLEVSQINHLVYERWHRRPPSDIVKWHRRVQQDVLRTLAEKPEDWFSRRDRSPYWPGDLDGHSAEHRVKDMEAVLGS